MTLKALVMIGLVISAFASASTDFRILFRQLPRDFNDCVEFYHVQRKLAPLVWHHFIGAQVKAAGNSEGHYSAAVFGMPKGSTDLGIFRDAVAGGTLDPSASLKYLGQACAYRAIPAVDEAATISEAWERAYPTTLQGLPRYIATPILGRPCKDSADEIEGGLAPYLE